MSDALQKLKSEYQAISAPPHLAARVRASVADSRSRTGFWMPAAVACTAILAVLWLPLNTEDGPDVTTPSTLKPSVSALAALKPNRPSVAAPSLSQLRSVSVPKMPAKPKAATPAKPQSTNQIENESLEENDNAYI